MNPLSPEQALANLENITKAWLGSLGADFTYEQAAVAQQSLQTIRVAITPKPEAPPAKNRQK